ncbi:MAG: aminotransferase class I/II-fold pyridoxal phosphate-dependent enzyme [Holophagaceae bacterium]|nr:aminotransferase class I/II-fold pyridoxal phosphate-dependent enzyme [Holophagaceae bacterium]
MSDGDSAKPQTTIFSKGYDPQLSEGAAIPPVFRTSTFLFKAAEEGKRAFEIAYGLSPAEPGESPALIYTRVNNPNSEILEDKARVWDGAEDAAAFSSGMGAISTACQAFLEAGDTLLFTDSIYGGTEYLFLNLLPRFNIKAKHFPIDAGIETVEDLVKNDPTVKVIFLESPSNPTMMICDVPGIVAIARKYSTGGRRIVVMVDNTLLGPIFSSPLKLGADIVLYSATKFFGGHADLIAGLAMGSREDMEHIKSFRTILGTNPDPDSAWLIHRSLGTLQLRMEHQQENTIKIVEFLLSHPAVERVSYPGLDCMGHRQVELWKRQFTGSGSTLSFTIKGGEAEAFRILNAVKHIKLAVSLGGVISLIEHPSSMTHSDLSPEQKSIAGITENLIRLSIGLEDADDLIADLKQALIY